MNQPDEKLFVVLARASEGRVGMSTAQNLANTAWAFATIKKSGEKLFVALARAAEGQMG